MLLRDPVHGLLRFTDPEDDVVRRLLDTPQVQRLRRIRALGPASIAFPGAEHSRFGHALGSAHVMKQYLDRVRLLGADIPEPDRVDSHHARAALAAALLHDVGHGPLSHSFEAITADPGARHEAWTRRMIEDPDSGVRRVLHDFDPELPRTVAELIDGRCEVGHLARAVSGTFDVDRLDYLMRDSYMTGVRYGVVDLPWLLASLRLHPHDDGNVRLAVDGEKGLTAVEQFFLARLYMYQQVYLHKAVRAAELLLREIFAALREAQPQPWWPEALRAYTEGRDPSLAQYEDMDDPTLLSVLRRLEDEGGSRLARLCGDFRLRRLPKTLALRRDVDISRAKEALRAAVDGDADTRGPVTVDVSRAQIFAEDDALMVLEGGRARRLLEASTTLRALEAEPYVRVRALFPEHARDRVIEAMAAYV